MKEMTFQNDKPFAGTNKKALRISIAYLALLSQKVLMPGDISQIVLLYYFSE